MTLALLAIPAQANAQTATTPGEKWERRAYPSYGDWKNILVRARVTDDRTGGTIEVAGVKWETAFQVEGFDRRWDFGQRKTGGYRYSFVIEPDGIGRYYDFRDGDHADRATDIMECRQVRS
jgi:hypothetical protein